MSVYFVSGIDTGCGKTFVTGKLAKMALDSGKTAITQKFVQTGNEKVSEDIEAHRAIMGVDFFKEDLDFTTCPYIFKFPASAHLASRIDGVEIDLDKIAACTRKLSSKYDEVFVEGAGGLMVPVKEDFLTIDYIVREALDLILVTSAKLGSINHSILSIEACANRGVNLKKLVYNNYPKEDSRLSEESKSYILNYAKNFYPDLEFIEID